jgi:N-acetyl-anhydromuramyl-L-alanine amidase AmpD
VAGLREEIKALHLARHANTANVSVNAGGIGVWVASTCAAVSMALCIALGAMVIHQQAQIQRLNDYLTVIYTRAPNLAPESSH